MMRPVVRTCLLSAIVLAAGFAAADEPKTALGQWMKKNMGNAMAADPPDFASLKANFALIAKNAPDAKAYPGWADFANKGADAASKNDKEGVKAACKGCHTAPSTTGAKNMKEQYKGDPAAPKNFP